MGLSGGSHGLSPVTTKNCRRAASKILRRSLRVALRMVEIADQYLLVEQVPRSDGAPTGLIGLEQRRIEHTDLDLDALIHLPSLAGDLGGEVIVVHAVEPPGLELLPVEGIERGGGDRSGQDGAGIGGIGLTLLIGCLVRTHLADQGRTRVVEVRFRVGGQLVAGDRLPDGEPECVDLSRARAARRQDGGGEDQPQPLSPQCRRTMARLQAPSTTNPTNSTMIEFVAQGTPNPS